MSGLHILPDALKQAVADGAAAADELCAVRAELSRAADAGYHLFGAYPDRGMAPSPAAKISTFARQWRKELEIIADLLTGYHQLLVDVADGYLEAESVLAADLNDAAETARQAGC